MIHGLRFAAPLFGVVLLMGCTDTCPKGYEFKNHACVAKVADGGSDGGQSVGGAGGDTATGGVAGSSTTACTDSTFGETCMTADDCGCDSGYCAGYPGEAGICTHSGCLEDETVCPAGWKCQDFSAFQAGLSLCTPP